MHDIPKLLRDNGVPEASDPKHGQTVDDLAYATRNGDPAIAHQQWEEPWPADKPLPEGMTEPPPPEPRAHVVTVEKVVTNPDGSRNVVYTDPGDGARHSVPESEFNKDFSGWTITTNKD